MKKSVPALMALLAALLLSSCKPAAPSPSPSPTTGGEGLYKPGTYTASAQGYAGEITVEVTVDESKITELSIDGPDETPTVGGEAIKTLTESIKAAGSDQVDGVSGATVTSDAVKKATGEALAQAKR